MKYPQKRFGMVWSERAWARHTQERCQNQCARPVRQRGFLYAIQFVIRRRVSVEQEIFCHESHVNMGRSILSHQVRNAPRDIDLKRRNRR